MKKVIGMYMEKLYDQYRRKCAFHLPEPGLSPDAFEDGQNAGVLCYALYRQGERPIEAPRALPRISEGAECRV